MTVSLRFNGADSAARLPRLHREKVRIIPVPAPLRNARVAGSVCVLHERPHAGEVFRGVDAGVRRGRRHRHADFVAVPQRTQLLQRFEFFERRRGELRIACEKPGTVGIDPQMTVNR